VKLRDLQNLDKMEVLDGSTTEMLPHQLTEFVIDRSEIEFAIDQLKKYGSRWQLRKNEKGDCAVFIVEQKSDRESDRGN